MEFLFSKNGAFRGLAIMLVIFVLLFLLVNLLIYIVPLAVILLMVYKSIKYFRTVFQRKSKAEEVKFYALDDQKRELHFEEAIKDNRVIDVEYTEV